MAAKDLNSTLQRKLAHAGETAAPAGDRSALRALRRALARTASDSLELALTVIGATQSRAAQDQVLRYLDDDRLMLLLDGPDGLSGAATLDLALTAALIQQQTTGKVSPNPAVARAFTETDAALAAPLIQTMLRQGAELTQVAADRACLEGYGFGARAEEAQSLALTLDSELFRVFELTIDIAGGLHQGTIGLILPERDAALASPVEPASAPRKGPSLGDRIMRAPAQLSAVLCRVQLPLAKLTGMQPGEVLHLPPLRLDQTELIAISGECVSAGRLGQVDGFRAIRLNETAPPAGAGSTFDPVSDNDAGAIASRTARQLVQRDMPGLLSADGTLPDPKSRSGAEADRQEDVMLSDMTADQAAAEISQLAGLGLEDQDEADPQPTG